MYEKMQKTIKDTFKNFSDQLKCDTLKHQELETKIRPLPDLVKKMKILGAEVKNLQIFDMDITFLKHFVERDLPILTHLQLCEGLNIIQGKFLPELKMFTLH